jgi:cyanophycin synthetase
MVEKHHDGCEYRVTVLHGNVVRAWVRRPGGITGDGERTVAELIERFNREPRNRLAELLKGRPVLTLDEETQTMLSAEGYSVDSVIPDGEFVPMRRRANISAGGTYHLIAPDTLHPDNRALAVNAATTLGLDIAGIDIISGDPTESWRETGGIICEVNASPQLGYGHSEAFYGEVLTAVLGGKGDIPIHLIISPESFGLRGPLSGLAASAQCNAAASGTTAWIEGGGTLGPFADVWRASKAILLDTRVEAALVVMTEEEVLRWGLPAAYLASIRLVGQAGWRPPASLLDLIHGHSPQILRSKTGAQAGIAAA